MKKLTDEITTGNNIAQWYVVNTFSGNEDLAIENIRGKIRSYGLSEMIPEMRVIKYVEVVEEEIKRDQAPKTLKNTKYNQWTVLANGNYLKRITREVNKYPGYLFVKMIMTDESWYIVRNTPGVTGFIGSSGKGTKPFPVTFTEIWQLLSLYNGAKVQITEGDYVDKEGTIILDDILGEIYVQLDEKNQVPVQFFQIVIIDKANPKKEDKNSSVKSEEKEQVKEVILPKFQVGNTVTINNGSMANMKGVVASINEGKGTAIVNVAFFGRMTEVEVDFKDVSVN